MCFLKTSLGELNNRSGDSSLLSLIRMSWRLRDSSAFAGKRSCDFFQQVLVKERKLVGPGLQLVLPVPEVEDAHPASELLGAKPKPEQSLNHYQNREQEKGNGYEELF